MRGEMMDVVSTLLEVFNQLLDEGYTKEEILQSLEILIEATIRSKG
jgi:hypothetical protein